MRAALLLLCFMLFAGSVSANDSAVLISEYNAGQIYRIGDYRLLNLRGSYYEMGCQYGALQSEALHEISSIITRGLAQDNEKRVNYENTAQYIVAGYPLRYRQFLRGVAEGSGLSYKQVLAVNNLEAYSSLIYGSGCSFIAVAGNYTQDKQLLWGRNFDGAAMQFARWLQILVLHPNDGSLATASVGIAGVFFTTTGFNSAGLWLELNNAGQGSGGNQRLFAPITLLSTLENSTQLGDIGMWLDSVRPDAPFNYTISAGDDKTAISYEWRYDKTVARLMQNGFLAATNNYQSPAWHEFVGIPDVASEQRYCNLQMAAQKYCGEITSDILRDIISVPVDAGGVCFTQPAYTAWQVVSVPAQQTLWLRSPLVGTDWAKVDLRRFWQL